MDKIVRLRNIPDIYAYMQKLITDKIIFPEHVTTCRRFTNTIIVGHDCTPENLVVLFTWREADSDAMTLLDTLPTISSLYDKLIRINLSNNTYEPVIVDADEQERLSGGVINMYEWWAGYSPSGMCTKNTPLSCAVVKNWSTP